MPRGIPTLVSLRDQRWKEIRHILTPTFSLHKLKGVKEYPLQQLGNSFISYFNLADVTDYE